MKCGGLHFAAKSSCDWFSTTRQAPGQGPTARARVPAPGPRPRAPDSKVGPRPGAQAPSLGPGARDPGPGPRLGDCCA